jgi:hypothetical protein
VRLEEHGDAIALRQHGLQGAVEVPGLFGAVRSVQVFVIRSDDQTIEIPTADEIF